MNETQEEVATRMAYQAELYDEEQKLRAIREQLLTLRGSRELSLALTNIEQAELWLRAAREKAQP